MGYSLEGIDCLFQNHSYIKTIEDALKALNKGKYGYEHKFIKGKYDEINCIICHHDIT